MRLSGQDSGRGTFSQRHAVLDRPGDRGALHPAEQHRRRARRASRSSTRCSRKRRCSASNTATRSPTRTRWCCGRRSSATSPTARRSSSTSSSPPAKRKWLRMSRPRHAAAARLRGPGARAQLGAPRALPAALRRGQHAGRQLHHAGQLLPHPAPPDAARLPQAADRDDAEVAAAPQARGVDARRDHRRHVASTALLCDDAADARRRDDQARHGRQDPPRRRCAPARSTTTCSRSATKRGIDDVDLLRIEQLYPFPPKALVNELVALQATPRWSGARKSRRTRAPGPSSSRWLERMPGRGRRQAASAPRYAGRAGRRPRRRPASPSATRPSRRALIADALGHS